MSDAAHKAATFKALHEGDGIFVMPNAWDRASARLLAMAGFEAVGTTSAGVNFSAGCADGSGQRDAMLTVIGEIATDVTVPCNGDIENGYGDAPEAVAETIRRSIAAEWQAATSRTTPGARVIRFMKWVSQPRGYTRRARRSMRVAFPLS